MSYSFFSTLSRLKYINRWGLMNNTRNENLSEHSLEVAFIAHALCIIKNKRFGGNIDADKVAVYAMFHDCTEIITGDLPTPIKYSSKKLREAYKAVEEEAGERLLSTLPDDLREEYEKYFVVQDGDEEIWKIVKSADRLSALIKCIDERRMGNMEFCKAEESTRKIIEENIFLIDGRKFIIGNFLLISPIFADFVEFCRYISYNDKNGKGFKHLILCAYALQY